MGRVLRLLRLVKTIQGFDALYIMTTAMQGSVTVLFWSFVRLVIKPFKGLVSLLRAI